MCVLFLDFDGPIFPEKIHLFPQNRGQAAQDMCIELDLHPMITYWYADPFAIAILNDLRSIYPYRLVISSSWADDRLHERHHIEALLVKNKISYDMHPDWRTPRRPELLRHQQIQLWLEHHPEVQNYLILDDIVSAPAMQWSSTYQKTSILQRNVFLADENDGYSYRQFKEMQGRVKEWI